MPPTTNCRRKPELTNFTLKLLLPRGEVVAIPMPEREATLRIDLDDDPTFELKSGAFSLRLNAVCFQSEQQS